MPPSKKKYYSVRRNQSSKSTYENKFWWWTILKERKEKADSQFLEHKKVEGCLFYPDNIHLLYKPFKLTPLNKVKIVLVTRSPPRSGNGLGISLRPGTVFKKGDGYTPQRMLLQELFDDLGFRSNDADLTPWAKNGVLMLNANPITTKKGLKSWSTRYKQMIQSVIRNLSSYHDKIVFILLGEGAAKLEKCIDKTRHLVIITSYPATYSGRPTVHQKYRAFSGSKVFSRACTFLDISTNIWRLK